MKIILLQDEFSLDSNNKSNHGIKHLLNIIKLLNKFKIFEYQRLDSNIEWKSSKNPFI